MEQPSYIHPAQENGRQFYQDFQGEGPVVMLNLLKFRDRADYSGLDIPRPDQALTGEEAYQRYMELTLPFLEEAGSQLLFQGRGGHFLIGPMDETWDLMLLVQHPSLAEFLAFADNEDYLKIAGHRTAALADSRLLPMAILK